MGRYGWITSFACALSVLLVGSVAGLAVANWIESLPPMEQTPSRPAPSTGSLGEAGTVDGLGNGNAKDEREGMELFAFILQRNLGVYVLLLLGLLSGGLVALAILLANGIALGQLIGLARAAGMPSGELASLLVPHGVLEIGAFCVAGAVGLQGFRLALALGDFRWESVKALRLGLVLVFGATALSVAAAIEAFVTGEFAESL